MYLSILFALGATVAIALGGLQLTGALAVASERHAAAHYADIALEAARQSLIAQIAAQVEAGTPDGPFVAPAPGAPAPICAAPAGAPSPCPFEASVRVELEGQTGTASAGPPVPAQNVQRTPGASEDRLAATLTATVTSPAGTLVRHRSLVLRTFAVAPFASDDGSDEPVAGGLIAGDGGGTCDGSASCGGSDTRIHAKLICSNPADPSKCAGVPDRYVDDLEDESWHDAHAAASAWSR